MLKVDLDEAFISAIADRIAEQAYERLAEKFEQSKWPPLLSRSQMMDFLGIKDTKASELLNRQDFPVIREFGHPKVPTHLLFQWIDAHTEWVRENSEFFNRTA